MLNQSSVEMRISAPVLEDVCKKMIEVILHCLPQAIRGTIYKVGPMPLLRVVRVASGYRDLETDQVVWDGAIVNGRDKLSQKWSFKSEPVWKGFGIHSTLLDLIPC